MIELTGHFMAHEFLVSEDHPDLALAMTLSDEEIDKLFLLCVFGLEPVREAFGPVTILSGKRSLALNVAVRGKENSQHLLAEAADYTIPGADILDVYGFVTQELKWPGQVRCYPGRKFIHLALPHRGITPHQVIINT